MTRTAEAVGAEIALLPPVRHSPRWRFTSELIAAASRSLSWLGRRGWIAD